MYEIDVAGYFYLGKIEMLKLTVVAKRHNFHTHGKVIIINS